MQGDGIAISCLCGSFNEDEVPHIFVDLYSTNERFAVSETKDLLRKVVFRETDGGLVAELPDGLFGVHFKVTMKGKHLQVRCHLGGGMKRAISHRSAEADPLAWEEPHYHGFMERYEVLTGRLGFVYQDRVDLQAICIGDGTCEQAIVFPSRCVHVVLVKPGSTFMVTTTGVAVPNPDRNGNDWFPAGDGFACHRDLDDYRVAVERILRG